MFSKFFVFALPAFLLCSSSVYAHNSLSYNASCEQGFDVALFWELLALFGTLLLFVIYRYRSVHRDTQAIKKYLDVIDKNILLSSGDSNGVITDVSEALCTTLGYTKEELIGQKHKIMRHPDTPDAVYDEMWKTIKKGRPWNGELKKLKKDGTFFWVDAHISPIFAKDGSIEGYSIINQDITDKKRIEELCITDQLTQISNRLHLQNSFDKELNTAKRYHRPFSIILLDVDNFKAVNDTYGHHVGDMILIRIAEILKENIRDIDVLGRWGGEEFLIICHETDAAQAAIVAEKLRAAVETASFESVGRQTCSFGVSEYKTDDLSSSEILKRADKLLYEAKKRGKNIVVTAE